jgi:hypothetical protein
MKRKSDNAKPANRDDRLKAALKANLARRKAQARARATSVNNTQAIEQAEKKKD